MTAMPVAEPMTAQEFSALPEDEHRWELTSDDTLISPLLPGFAPKLDAVFGE
jgi:hypothetical protein